MQNERTSPFDPNLVKTQNRDRFMKAVKIPAILITFFLAAHVVYKSVSSKPVSEKPTSEQLTEIKTNAEKGGKIQSQIDQKEEDRLKAAIEEAKKKASYEYNPTDN
jgi:hypothetical protein